jgi:hypothetical protein
MNRLIWRCVREAGTTMIGCAARRQAIGMGKQACLLTHYPPTMPYLSALSELA